MLSLGCAKERLMLLRWAAMILQGADVCEPCNDCGLQSWLSNGLKREIVDADGKLLPDVHPAWLPDVVCSRQTT